MPPGDKRSAPRRAITYPAFLDLGDDRPPRECLLCDASQSGALVQVSDPKSLPDEFTLALSVDGLARRRCRVMWRGRDQIGVAFVKAFSGPVRALDVAHAGAELALQGHVVETVGIQAPQEPVQEPVQEAEAPAAEAPEPAAEEREVAPVPDDSDMFDIDTLARA
jgi:hypothetical protein